MKKKLVILLIAIIPTLMPNLASAIAIDVGDVEEDGRSAGGLLIGSC